ncbi:hypothetical protein N3883_004380 [Escherichia coli]|nr:hypothetical protein [Escherichia coli]
MKLSTMQHLIIVSSDMFFCEGIKLKLYELKQDLQIESCSHEEFLSLNKGAFLGSCIMLDFDCINNFLWQDLNLMIKNGFLKKGKLSAIYSKNQTFLTKHPLISPIFLSYVFNKFFDADIFAEICVEWLDENNFCHAMRDQNKLKKLGLIYDIISGKTIKQLSLEYHMPVNTLYSRKQKMLDLLGYKRLSQLILSISFLYQKFNHTEHIIQLPGMCTSITRYTDNKI